jgi:phosphohistidine phosphatase
MDLILWRHADAEAGSPDQERKLTAKGRRQAARMANWLQERLPNGVRVLSSPALRAQLTARALGEDFEVVNALDVAGDARALLEACGWPAADATVVAVGHQPTLGQAAAFAMTGKADDWSLRKGAIIWLEARDRGAGLQARMHAVLAPDLI